MFGMRDRYVRGGGEERRGEKRVFTVRNYFRIRGRSLILGAEIARLLFDFSNDRCQGRNGKSPFEFFFD